MPDLPSNSFPSCNLTAFPSDGTITRRHLHTHESISLQWKFHNCECYPVFPIFASINHPLVGSSLSNTLWHPKTQICGISPRMCGIWVCKLCVYTFLCLLFLNLRPESATRSEAKPRRSIAFQSPGKRLCKWLAARLACSCYHFPHKLSWFEQVPSARRQVTNYLRMLFSLFHTSLSRFQEHRITWPS